jgi:hypothetical protein
VELDAFRRRADNLYERVRALFFLDASPHPLSSLA